MGYLLLKTLLSAVVITAASETGKHNPLIGAILASVPLVSVLAMIWLYLDTGSTAVVACFARDIFWLVLPSLLLFLIVPALLERGVGFFVSLAAGILATVAAYGLTVVWLQPQLQ